MAKVAQRDGAVGAKRLVNDGEICPVCKSSTYLNKDMRFMVNPECYHKMCESCVDRIFSHGPALCPVAGCKRTLRKGKFRQVTFEDIRVEKEVDIRRRITKIFNRREEDFESLRDYNDYLNEVEDITFNLINGIDVAATTERIKQYQEANRQAIDENESAAANESKSFQARQAAEKEAARQLRAAAAREDEERRREKLVEQQDILNRLATGQASDARKIAVETQRAAVRRKNLAAARQGTSNGPDASTGFSFRGLKEKVAAESEKPYDPFGGYEAERKWFVVQDDYGWDYFNMAKKDPLIYAGGYDLKEYYSRALCDAFAGLGVFVGDELGAKDKPSEAPVATQAAAVAAKSSSDDVL